MPIFALANAGVELRADLFTGLGSPLALGVVLGLLAGKQLGITGACWLVRRLGWAEYPHGASLRHIWGAGCLAGIGFTMSIFIANLAFEGDPRAVELAKLAVLLSSLAAGLGGWLLLRFMPEKARG
jgi:NhaA family Na+:H+ antiporter